MIKPQAILVDIDGTLTKNTAQIRFPVDGTPEDKHKFYEDVNFYDSNKFIHILNYDVVDIVNGMYNLGVTPIYLTAREDIGDIRENTLKFLEKNNLMKPNSKLLMRKSCDYRSNAQVKEDLYNEFVKKDFRVLFALDDEPDNIQMFRDLGIPCQGVVWEE